MNRSFYGLVVATMIALVAWGCAPSDTAEPAGDTDASSSDATAEAHPEHSTLLCGKCGEEKGADACCAADAETCESCGKHTGSALCCVELSEDAAGKDICSSCGHAVADGEHHHCDSDCETCEKCGLHAGSPACCKLKS